MSGSMFRGQFVWSRRRAVIRPSYQEWPRRGWDGQCLVSHVYEVFQPDRAAGDFGKSGGAETTMRYLSDPELRARCRRHVFEEKDIHNTPMPTHRSFFCALRNRKQNGAQASKREGWNTSLPAMSSMPNGSWTGVRAKRRHRIWMSYLCWMAYLCRPPHPV